MSAGSVEQLLVKISADISGLKSGLAQGARETKKFGDSVQSIDKNVQSFRRQALGAIQGLGGLENALDAVSGKGHLTAGTISQLTQLLPLMASPVGAATTALGALGITVLKVVESERKMKENRTAALLKEVKEQAQAAAKGWEAYYKAIEEGHSKTAAGTLRNLAERIGLLDKENLSFQERAANLKATNATLAQENIAIEAEIKAWKEAGQTHGWFGRTLEQVEQKLAKNNAQIAANTATIEQGYGPAIKEIAGSTAAAAAATARLNAQLQWQADNIGTTEDRLNAWLELQDMEIEKTNAATEAMEQRAAAQSELNEKEQERRDDKTELAAQARRTDQLNQEAAAYDRMGQAAADAFVTIATESGSAEEATKHAMRAVMQEIIKMMIARVMANSAVYGSEIAVQTAPVAGPGAIGIGAAAAQALSAILIAMIPGFKEGGIVGGHLGQSDPNVIRANRGEEVLRTDDPRHRNNIGRGIGGGNSFHYHEHGFVPRSEAEMARLIRRHMKNAIEDLVMTGDLNVVRN